MLKKGAGREPNILTMTITGERSWIKQEMGKGSLMKKWVSGVKSSDGGWAYNPVWNGNPPPDSALLKASPYFKPFSQFTDANGQNLKSVHGSDGGNLADQYAIRAFLLAHDVPAISNPAGSDLIDLYPGSDMNTELRSGTWGDWKHSDIKNQDIGRVWKLYSSMANLGKLSK